MAILQNTVINGNLTVDENITIYRPGEAFEKMNWDEIVQEVKNGNGKELFPVGSTKRVTFPELNKLCTFVVLDHDKDVSIDENIKHTMTIWVVINRLNNSKWTDDTTSFVGYLNDNCNFRITVENLLEYFIEADPEILPNINYLQTVKKRCQRIDINRTLRAYNMDEFNRNNDAYYKDYYQKIFLPSPQEYGFNIVCDNAYRNGEENENNYSNDTYTLFKIHAASILGQLYTSESLLATRDASSKTTLVEMSNSSFGLNHPISASYRDILAPYIVIG